MDEAIEAAVVAAGKQIGADEAPMEVYSMMQVAIAAWCEAKADELAKNLWTDDSSTEHWLHAQAARLREKE